MKRAAGTEQKFMEGVAGDKAEMQMGRSCGLPWGQANRLFFTPEALKVFEGGSELVEAELLRLYGVCWFV